MNSDYVRAMKYRINVLLCQMRKAIRLFLQDHDARSFIVFAFRHPLLLSKPLPMPEQKKYPGLEKYIETDLKALAAPAFLHELEFKDEGDISEEFDIRLAAQTLPGVKINSIPWNASFDDVEDSYALQRFAWLLPMLLQMESDGIGRGESWQATLKAIENWIELHLEPHSGITAWHPYTVSERIVNWIIGSLFCCQQIADYNLIVKSLMMQTGYLIANLEYFGEEFTCNHLSNNGRALYVAGLVLKNKEAVRAGRYILLNERKRLFCEKGFLREGSSHYQFLVTRNYCEVLWFAIQYGDKQMEKELKATVAFLCSACSFFLVTQKDGSWTIPLIGDLSPDYPPQWLLGVPLVGATLTGTLPPEGHCLGKGWHNFFSRNNLPSRKKLPVPLSKKTSENREWARIDHRLWTVFAHINPNGYPKGHSHNDSGSISVFYDGIPILVDAGRRRYVDDIEGRRGRDSWSHTILVVDGVNPAQYQNRFYPKLFFESRVGEKPKHAVKENVLEIQHGGYARIRGVGNYRRTITCLQQSMQIRDSVFGKGRHDIYLLFQIPHKTEMKGGKIVFKCEKSQMSFQLVAPKNLSEPQIWYGPSPDRRFGWGSQQYGDLYYLSSVVAFGRVSLPWSGETLLTRED